MKILDQRNHNRPILRVGCALLASWIFILSVAGVSPALHAWLHADSSCARQCAAGPQTSTENSNSGGHNSDSGGHYCGVIALQGTDAPATTMALPERGDHEHLDFETSHNWLRTHGPENRLQARAPPIEIAV